MKTSYIFNIVFTVVFCIFSLDASAIDRRQKQFKEDNAYLLLPAPYSVPGLGSGIAFLAQAANMGGSYADILLVNATGAATATYYQLSDVHLISEFLVLGADTVNVSKIVSNSYQTRGMTNYNADYKLLVSSLKESTWDVRLTNPNRWVEAYYKYYKTEAKVSKIMDSKGDLLIEFSNPEAVQMEKSLTGLRFDYTDDYADPREGIRLEVSKTHSTPISNSVADYYVNDRLFTAYLPIGKSSVWAFHAMSSDAEVITQGVTDPDKIATELGLPCAYADCPEEARNLIDQQQKERENGTAASLGGFNYLRSFPLNRFQGAHTRLFSTELRLNFAQGIRPFNFWIWKDVSTSFQWVLFHDQGTVAEELGDLWKESASSTGTGFRMVAASGFVYRADIATGDEGNAFSMVFLYPW